MSLRRYLLTSLLGSLGLLLVISTIAGYLESRHELEEVFDAQLAQHAKVLRASLASSIQRDTGLVSIDGWHGDVRFDDQPDTGEDLERDTLGHLYENKIAFQLWSHDKKLQARSDSAPFDPFASFAAGYSAQQHGDHIWRVFTLTTPKGGWVQVGHRDDIRDELATEIATQMMWPTLLLMPFIALLIILVLRKALQPLQALVESVGLRSPDQLAPLPTHLAPDEVKPLVDSFNSLMARLATAFKQQKRFIADAAHELKTPLAALQVHTENALAADGEERAKALQHIKSGIVRSNRLVEQLLLFSRLEHLRQTDGSAPPTSTLIDLVRSSRQLIDDLQVFATSRQQQLLFECEGNHSLLANEATLRALLRNLIDNAIRYSPMGSSIHIHIFTDEWGLCWRLCDQGKGIAKDLHEQVFEPFFRELGTDTSGTGLGLAIAREAAQQLGARISLSDNTPQGLCVSVRWPIKKTQATKR